MIIIMVMMRSKMVMIQIRWMVMMIIILFNSNSDDDDITKTVIILTLIFPRRLCRALLNLRKYTDALVYGAKQYGPSQDPSKLELHWDSWNYSVLSG